MLQKKLLHCEVFKNSTKDLFPSCIMLTNIGSTEEKYVLRWLNRVLRARAPMMRALVMFAR